MQFSPAYHVQVEEESTLILVGLRMPPVVSVWQSAGLKMCAGFSAARDFGLKTDFE